MLQQLNLVQISRIYLQIWLQHITIIVWVWKEGSRKWNNPTQEYIIKEAFEVWVW